MAWDESKHPRDSIGRFSSKRSEKSIYIPLNFFAERGLAHLTPLQLRKGIRAIKRKIKLHYNKIANPALYCENWPVMTQNEKDGLIEYWRKDIAGKEQQVRDRIDRLKELGENTDEYGI